MTAKELIELLQAQPPHAEVELVCDGGNDERTEDVVAVSPVDPQRTQVVRVQIVGESAI